MDRNLTAIIEKADNNYSAYLVGVDGITATGRTVDDVKRSLIEAVKFFIEGSKEFGGEIPEELKGEYKIDFKMKLTCTP